MGRKKSKLNMSMLAVILGLAWPTMLEELMQTAVQYIDTAMVGALGTQATAAVGATSTVNWLAAPSLPWAWDFCPILLRLSVQETVPRRSGQSRRLY